MTDSCVEHSTRRRPEVRFDVALPPLSADTHRMRSVATLRWILATALIAGLASCGDDDAPTGPGRTPRTYRMGFSSFPPQPNFNSLIQNINTWPAHADVGLILSSPPWDLLLAGHRPDSLVGANEVGLADFYRGKGLRVIVSVDPTNGLDRSADDPKLVAAGRSLAEPEIQMLLRNYVTAMDTLVHPDYISFASETNLVRAAAPESLYDGLVQAANDAAAAVRAVDASVKLYTTVQVEVAWGKLGGPGGTYQGIDQDRADFPFVEALGLSSYPYLGGFAEPESIPINYYTRLVESDPVPVMVIEGGWSSVQVALPTSPDHQRRYIVRHAQLLDEADAVAWFQITFTDIDLAAWPQPPGAPLNLFAYLGLVDKDFNAKPALAAWDAIFARPRL